ncbi:dolichyl-diphosphooligosaccharide-protein glycotransferase [Ascoidea rubescens DSM 1968]|uniref:Dolichyl-diphosphooligosaccharide--protein glycosyltransferase subunit WBP1 n=1 Tax=Ascoidea rubescens DSM 1968 TaxID=1344418 RepID=A0A1D2VB06_9ASCO|nr:Dolichyl-diphosphooligosaccharide-protein glycosyltransferase 48kDa subunit [Ascoidea rubescens DSM 1968]ODV58848.1 Dolichyl-diphosphooligosaccharide-protein glycosyltransferase 48kDa subunit [Ascoidea rubescens DSM 1968]
MLFSSLLLLVLISLSSLVLATSKKLLLVHDESIDLKSDYSVFIGDLAGNSNYQLSYLNVDDLTQLLAFKILNENVQNLYDNLIIFPLQSQKNFNRKVSSSDLINFNNNNGNIFIITNDLSLNTEVRLFLNQLGIYPSPKYYKIFDHFNYYQQENQEDNNSEDLHDTLKLSTNEILNNNIVSKIDDELILYKGASAIISNNELIVPVLSSSRTAFNFNKKKSIDYDLTSLSEDLTWSLGNQNYLIASFQSLLNSRVSWIGSNLFLSNEFYSNSKDNNRKVVNDLISWTFQNKSILKIDYIEYYKTNNNSVNKRISNDSFKELDEIIYNIAIEEFDGKVWKPYVANDLQLEIIMLDPYYRITLKPIELDSKVLSFNDYSSLDSTSNLTFYSQRFDSNNNNLISRLKNSGIYTSNKVRLPDQHGIFKFKINYERKGLTFLKHEHSSIVRNLASEEFSKSWEISNSRVYLTSIFSLLFVWLIFTNLVLYSIKDKFLKTKKNV